MISVEDLTKSDALTLDEAAPRLEENLRKALAGGFLSDVVECAVSDVATPEAVAPWSGFDYHLYRSEAATRALRSLLRCTAPGTSNSFEDILSAIARGSSAGGGTKQKNYCYLVGGQVRDVLRGQLSMDIDFNYSCSAQEVALVTVAHGWPTKYKCIGEGVTSPNYVLIGDEGSETYLEGFCIDFNATRPCYTNDLTMNSLLYDLTNDVIIDKCTGVSDIRAGTLRLTLAAGETFAAWAAENFTPGNKELRYIKFLLRSEAKGEPLTYDAAECAFIVESLRTALRTNADALGGFWLGYTLKAQLQDPKGVGALRTWVDKHGGPAWWDEQWAPLVRKCAAPGALPGVDNGSVAHKPTATSTAWPTATPTVPAGHRRSWLWMLRCFRRPQVAPEPDV
eukprot:gnl/TRDRNA2_/TRDRNA2_165908_c0_seq2.p1 gnl/TRDRNA2_/TRDRNA2_165908_c0~~gnl/TRDRNA2_/TRDRNA2_165908_c0_seq2.p1  ORF type:complete len:395 (-),score=68.86 gnl/TRDRNA2_/TRDRNA2_165908_c0_seq2:627-1811(-)